MTTTPNYTDTSDVSDAAIQRALELAGLIHSWTVEKIKKRVMTSTELFPRAIINHARMIEKYEPETLVDPLVGEADAIVRKYYPEVRDDYTGRRQAIALAALKRGITLAKEVDV